MDLWEQVIGELEESLEYVQCALETGNWDGSEAPVMNPRPSSLPTPTPEQRGQVVALLEEVTATETQLVSEMRSTQAELGQAPKKLQAARRYSGSEALRSS